MLWVGLDVGYATTSMCLMDAMGEVIAEGQLATDPAVVANALGPHAEAIELIGVEACAASLNLTRKLRAQGYPVALFEARSASKYLRIRRNKTDANDARGLAEIARIGGTVVPRVYLKGEECQRIRSQLALRHQIVRQRVILEALLQANLRLHGGRWSTPASGTSLERKVSDEMTRLGLVGTSAGRDLLPVLGLAVSMRRYVETLDRALAKEVKAHPVCRRFLTIDGVGPIAALSFFSAIEDHRRFSTTQSVGAYFGLAPMVRESGEKSRRAGISKMGNTLTRIHLCQAATFILSTRAKESQLRTWGSVLAARAGKRRARAAVARKLATIMLAMWRNDADFIPSRI